LTNAGLQPIKADVRSGSSLCENSDVELARRKFVSITLNNKRTALAVTVERRKERKQFCAFSARARFHTAWVKSDGSAVGRSLPVYPYQQTFSDADGMSQRCHFRTSKSQASGAPVAPLQSADHR
jgi:hypothetical protein